ncbi:MAG TPA: NAD-dependent epimerase/dehydratase family protein [Burkholderiales bacterium]|nr:NAD-dependent epimerase/dehydratase family protein [Burkholderiales bacterium]
MKRFENKEVPLLQAFVTGGTGFLGRILIDELLARRWQVRSLARTSSRARLLPAAVQVVQGTLADEDALLEGVDDADVVFHLAAATSGAWETHAEATVDGTRRMLKACNEAGVRRFVLVSSIAVYDKSSVSAESVLDESAPLLAATPAAGAYARGKLEAERLTRQYVWNRSTRTETVIVRPGLVYGRDRLVFPHLGEMVGQTRVAYGKPSLLLPLVEVHSCMDALIRVATSPNTPGNTYNIVDAHCSSRRDYLGALQSVNGHPQRVLYLPTVAVQGAAWAMSRLANGRGFDASAEKIRTRSIEPRYDTAALQRDTGWKPGATLDEGLVRSGVKPSLSEPSQIHRAGIIGAGRIAGAHVVALRSIPGVHITGILDKNLAAAQALAGDAGRAVAFDDTERFYCDARPELVHVVTPPGTHFAIAAEALRRGAHVLLEKPATTTVEECDALVAAAEARGLSVGVDETVVWDPLLRRARAALMHGVLGKLVHVEVFMAHDLSRGGRMARLLEDQASWEHELAGGPLEDLLPHALSAVRALCGVLELQHAESFASGRLDADFPDELRLMLASGSLSAEVGISLTARPDDFAVTARGTRATVRVDLQNMLFDCSTPLPGPRALTRGIRTLRSAGRIIGQTGANALKIATRRSLPPASPVHLIREHYAALSRGEPPPAALARCRPDIAIARMIWPHKPSVRADRGRFTAPSMLVAGSGEQLR